jgi:hypothetical protein
MSTDTFYWLMLGAIAIYFVFHFLYYYLRLKGAFDQAERKEKLEKN